MIPEHMHPDLMVLTLFLALYFWSHYLLLRANGDANFNWYGELRNFLLGDILFRLSLSVPPSVLLWVYLQGGVA